MTLADDNGRCFDFFRKRIEFVRTHCMPSDDIAGYILWGAYVDALAHIGAACSGARKNNREQFVEFLIEFKPDLKTISVPLLMHDLRRLAGNRNAHAAALLQHAAFREYEQAAATNRVWQSDDDRRAFSSILSPAACEVCHNQLWSVVRKNRYADLLYLQYRNPVVHGADIGLKTSSAVLPVPGACEPHYANHRYGASCARGDAERYRTRISFSLNYLINLLSDPVNGLEQRCSANGWKIPPFATIELN
jgi:hypothetical protein